MFKVSEESSSRSISIRAARRSAKIIIWNGRILPRPRTLRSGADHTLLGDEKQMKQPIGSESLNLENSFNSVMPAEAGIQGFRSLDSRLRGNDDKKMNLFQTK